MAYPIEHGTRPLWQLTASDMLLCCRTEMKNLKEWGYRWKAEEGHVERLNLRKVIEGMSQHFND